MGATKTGGTALRRLEAEGWSFGGADEVGFERNRGFEFGKVRGKEAAVCVYDLTLQVLDKYFNYLPFSLKHFNYLLSLLKRVFYLTLPRV